MKIGAFFRQYPVVFAILAVFIGCSAPEVFGAAAADVMTFQLLCGRAALSRNGGSTWLDLGPEPIAVRIQDMLRSEGDARAELKFPDGSLMRIRSNTRLTLLKGGVQLQVGECWFNLKKQPGIFQVMTPSTLCGVLGTTFDVSVDRFGRTQVRVFDGIVSAKAHGDSRNRQLVLQRGMMTSVINREHTGDQIRRFDASGEDTRIQSEWKNIIPMKFGPGRPEMPQGLPPMRQSTAEGWKPVFRQTGQKTAEVGEAGEKGVEELEEPEEPVNSARAGVEFFQKMQERRMHIRETGSNEQAAPYGLPPEKATDARLLDDAALSEGIGAHFGQTGSGAPGATGQAALREEYLRTRNQLVIVQDQLSQTLSEITAQKARLDAAGSDNAAMIQARERLSGLTEALKNSRERQSRLLQRLEILRNRLL